MLNKLHATLLFVRNFDESLKFYRDILEFTPTALDPGFAAFDIGERTLAILDITMAAKMISEEAVQPTQEGVARFLLAVFLEDCDAEYERLKAKGVNFIKPPTTQPWGQRTAYFTDPDGHIWEISHFPKEASQSNGE